MKIIKKISIIIFSIMLILLWVSNSTKATETDIKLSENKITNEKLINIETKERESSLNNQDIPSLEELEGYQTIDIVINKNTDDKTSKKQEENTNKNITRSQNKNTNENMGKTKNENITKDKNTNKKITANATENLNEEILKKSDNNTTIQKVSSQIKIEEKLNTDVSKESNNVESKNTVFHFIMLAILVILIVIIALYGKEYETIYA